MSMNVISVVYALIIAIMIQICSIFTQYDINWYVCFLILVILIVIPVRGISPEDNMTDEIVANHWNRRAEIYNHSVMREYGDRRTHEAWREIYSEAVSGKSGKLMDCGCGPGTVTLYVSDLGFEITDYDQSPEMLKVARRNAETFGIEAEFVQGDAEEMPFDDETFDVIVSQNMMWTVPHPDKVLSEWYRVLKPGGCLVYVDGDWFNDPKKTPFRLKLSHFITTFDRKKRETRKERNERERMGNFSHLWSFDARRPRDDIVMAEAAGFRNISVKNGLEKRALHGMMYWRYGFIYNYFMVTAEK